MLLVACLGLVAAAPPAAPFGRPPVARHGPAPRPPGATEVLDALDWHRALRSADWDAVADALRGIQQSGDESQSTLPALHALLAATDGERRDQVAYTILVVSNGDPRAARALDASAARPSARVVGLVRDLADAGKRDHALWLLGDRPAEGRAALPAVRALLRTTGDVDGCRVAKAVWQLEPGDRAAFDYLLGRMGSPDVAVRRAAADALRTSGRTHPAVVRAAVDRLGREADRDARLTLLDLVCRTAPARGPWARAAADAVAEVVRADPDEDLRWAAAVNALMLGDAVGLAAPVLAGVAADPKTARRVRDPLAVALCRFAADDDRIPPVVVGTLLGDGAEEVVGICLLLNQSPRATGLVLPELVKALGDGKRDRRAARVLGTLEGAAAAALPDLEAFAARTADPTTAAFARESIEAIRRGRDAVAPEVGVGPKD